MRSLLREGRVNEDWVKFEEVEEWAARLKLLIEDPKSVNKKYEDGFEFRVSFVVWLCCRLFCLPLLLLLCVHFLLALDLVELGLALFCLLLLLFLLLEEWSVDLVLLLFEEWFWIEFGDSLKSGCEKIVVVDENADWEVGVVVWEVWWKGRVLGEKR